MEVIEQLFLKKLRVAMLHADVSVLNSEFVKM